MWDGRRTDYVYDSYDSVDRLQFYVRPDGSVVAYEWDGNGNMVGRTDRNLTTQFEYDFDNRLVRVVYLSGGEVRFGYDGLGRRVFRQEGGKVRYFFYDGDRTIAEGEGNEWLVRYLLGIGLVGFVANGALGVYHADRLGSVRWVTDGGQNMVASYAYEGFGKVIGQSGDAANPYRFCGIWGYRDDGDAGLLHVGARYYDPQVGRFISRDPVLTEHPYLYCENEPVNRVDPTGHFSVKELWDWVWGSAGAAAGYYFGAMVGSAIAPGPSTTAGAIIGAGIGGGVGYLIGEGLWWIGEKVWEYKEEILDTVKSILRETGKLGTPAGYYYQLQL